MKINVFILGSRMHYAVPKIFSKNKLLGIFYTDVFYKRDSFFSNFLGLFPHLRNFKFIRRLMSRSVDGLEDAEVRTNKLRGILFYLQRRFCFSEEQYFKIYLKIVKKMGLWAAKQRYIDNCFYGVSGESSSFFEHIRLREPRSLLILEQVILPAEIRFRLLEEDKISANQPVSERWKNLTKSLTNNERKERELASFIICPSKFVVRSLLELGVPERKLRLVNYGVESMYPEVLKVVQRRRNRVNCQKLRILFVGQVGRRKGVGYIVDAVDRLTPGSFELRIIGAVQPGFPIEILSRPGIKYLGHIPKADISQHYSWADLFLFPSLAEGSATVCYEALQMGLKLIVTNESGSIVEDGDDGLLIKSKSSDEIVRAIGYYSKNREELLRSESQLKVICYKASKERYEEDLTKAIACIFAAG